MMNSVNCEYVMEEGTAFLERSLPRPVMRSIDQHLARCHNCRHALAKFQAVDNLMQFVNARTPMELGSRPEPPPGILERFSGAPWWLVSAVLHVLVIMLAGLISMAIDLPKVDESVVMVTELVRREPLKLEQDKTESKAQAALASDHDTPPTDPTSQQASEIVVPPDILAKAEIGDHFETINPDRPDTHSAFGNPDAQMFHSVQGSDDPPGGGGMGGTGLDDLIGVGGTASPGSGGGWGGGNGTGTGIQNGSGHGSFGNRCGGGRKLMVMRHGGNKKTEGAVDRGLAWLAKHQEADGHWDAMKFGANVGEWGRDIENIEFSCTGLALLAFLGAGHTEKIGLYKENVTRGLKWLKSKQDPDSGKYCKWNYGHSIAGMAMAEAAGMARIPDTIESAQKAVNVTCALNKKYEGSDRAGWGYMPEQNEKTNVGDVSNSGWSMMFLKSAKVAGLKVPNETVEGIHRFLDACMLKDKNKDGYPAHKYAYTPAEAEAAKTDNRGYIAILGRLFFGTPPGEVEEGTNFLIQTRKVPGGWGMDNPEGCDLYYYYYMTLITFQVGGDAWNQWNEGLKSFLPPKQIVGGDDDGSWNPMGTHSKNWGRVGQTALSILCMEVYYRYQKLKQ